jgi:hypothetical protein
MKAINAGTTKPSTRGNEQPMKTQISRGITQRLAMLVVPFLAVGSLTFAAPADNLATKVKGNGIVTMVATADDDVFGAFEEGDSFADNHFQINCRVNADGTANGIAHFFFGEEFSAAWGLDGMTLRCNIDTGAVSEDGTIVLQGLSYEKDFAPGIVWTETTPFVIVVDPAAGLLTMRWCELPFLALEITEENLTVQ